MECLIIENNTITSNTIKTVCNSFTEISIKNINENQESVLNTILKHKPQLIFINIESSHINIPELLLSINQCCIKVPKFIALSFSKEKAFDAYKYNFSDFILKPITELSIRKSILKHQKKNPEKEINTICLKSYKDYQYLNIDEILYLKADNNTTDFYMIDGSIVSAYKTLKVFENLMPKTFLRIHKSYIINKNAISRINYSKSVCVINNNYKIPFTKTYISNIDLINASLSKNTVLTQN